jgi:tRNA uridine 5-carboxymethylaminomethyl modification enzyme
VADKAGIQFKILNRSRGPAVHVRVVLIRRNRLLTCIVRQGPRCQADRDLYKKNMMETLQQCQHLSIVEGGVEDLILHENVVQGITLGTSATTYS